MAKKLPIWPGTDTQTGSSSPNRRPHTSRTVTMVRPTACATGAQAFAAVPPNAMMKVSK